MKNKAAKILIFILTIILLIYIAVEVFPKTTIKPENPIKTETSLLKVGIDTQSGMLCTSENEENNAESGENSDVPEEDQEIPEEESMEEDQEDSEEEPPEENEEGSEHGTGSTEKNDQKTENHPGENEDGNIPTEGGNENINKPGTGEEPGADEEGLVTDLYNRILLFSELADDTLEFYAYYSDEKVDSNIKVNYKHKNDKGNGTWLKKIDEHNYRTKLKLGQNYITIYYTNENGERLWTRITISYQADKANEKENVKGANPPIIKTNLDDWSEDIRIFEFTFTVDARKYDGSRIYSNCIQVWLDGELVSNPTGSGIYEYLLQFGRPVEGDISYHEVAVLAWDDEGNSRYVKYQIRHKTNDEGVPIGTATIEIDATTLGLGIIDEGEVAVNSGDTAATAVLKMLEDYGYSYKYNGSLTRDFYLASISRADAFRGAAIEERLKRLIERDGITFTQNSGRDQLGEFDYTRGSGWLYFINNDYCPGKSMSNYTLNGGEKISLRFTLAFGKDVGSSYTDGSTSLSSYCGKWVHGTIVEYEHDFEEAEHVEATKEADGYVLYLCKKCKEEKREILYYEGTEENNPEEGAPEGGNGSENGNGSEGGNGSEDGNESESGNESEGGNGSESGNESEDGKEPENGDGSEGEEGEDEIQENGIFVKHIFKYHRINRMCRE